MFNNERTVNYLFGKEIFEKIKPKLIEVHGEEILKAIKLHENKLFLDFKLCDYERVFCTLKEELREQCKIEIGNNPVPIITL